MWAAHKFFHSKNHKHHVYILYINGAKRNFHAVFLSVKQIYLRANILVSHTLKQLCN